MRPPLHALALALLLGCSGCREQPSTPKPAAPIGTQTVSALAGEQGSKAAASVAAAAIANESNVDSSAKSAVAGELSVAAANLPKPTDADAAEAQARVALALSGQLESANRGWAAARNDAAKLAEELANAKKQLAEEQAKSAREISALQAKLTAANDEYIATQRRHLNWAFHGVGVLLILLGIGCFTFLSQLPFAGPRLGLGLLAAGAGMIGAGICVAWVFAHLWVLWIPAALLVGLLGLAWSNHHHGEEVDTKK